MTVSWIHQRERGSRTSLNVMIWLALRIGRRLGRILSVPITAYFYLFSIRGRAASRAYLTRALGRRPRWHEVFRHFLTFSAIILDRPFLLTRRLHDYDIDVTGLEHLAKWSEQGRGCILLGSHLGSFEILRALAEADPRIRLRPLMHEGTAASTALFRALNPGLARKIIPLGSVSTMLQVKEALAGGEMVGILGDRAVRGDKVANASFLGAPAAFPVGPFVLSSLLEAPVVLCFGLYCGRGRYEIRFEPFVEGTHLPRGERDAALQSLVARYAARLEHECRRRPFNWFNFYDFWEQRPS
ncbi:MAG: lipid A biosynthesis acyltransferase [Pseudomonadota bacterium]